MNDYNLFWVEDIEVEVCRGSKVKLPEFLLDIVRSRQQGESCIKNLLRLEPDSEGLREDAYLCYADADYEKRIVELGFE